MSILATIVVTAEIILIALIVYQNRLKKKEADPSHNGPLQMHRTTLEKKYGTEGPRSNKVRVTGQFLMDPEKDENETKNEEKMPWEPVKEENTMKNAEPVKIQKEENDSKNEEPVKILEEENITKNEQPVKIQKEEKKTKNEKKFGWW